MKRERHAERIWNDVLRNVAVIDDKIFFASRDDSPNKPLVEASFGRFCLKSPFALYVDRVDN
jgi:hypothetical protein